MCGGRERMCGGERLSYPLLVARNAYQQCLTKELLAGHIRHQWVFTPKRRRNPLVRLRTSSFELAWTAFLVDNPRQPLCGKF
jgi:hypothetical protein